MGQRWKQIKLVAAGVAALLAIILLLQNRESVPVHFLWMDPELPQALLLLIVLLLGFALGVLIASIYLRPRKPRESAEKEG